MYRIKSFKKKLWKSMTIPVLCLLSVCLVGSVCFAAGVNFPEKEVTIISPWAPGGINDTLSRAIAMHSSQFLGKPVVVVNMPGGGSVVGNKFVERAKPDGHVLLMASITTVCTQYVSYTPNDIKNLTGVIQICECPPVLVVRADAPWKNIKEFIDYAKENPYTITCAHSGVGGSSHIYTIMLENKTGTKVKHVPYKGYAPSIVAVLGGHINATFVTPGCVRQYVEAGKLRVLGVASEERFYIFPNVPTFKEQGIDLVIEHWVGLMAPKDTPIERINILADAFDKAMCLPKFLNLLEQRGLGIQRRKGHDFNKFIEKEDKKWRDLLEKLEF